MTDLRTFEQDKTAVLIMDYQNKQLSALPEARRDKLLKNARKFLAAARSEHLPVIYVEVRSHQGPPEFKPWDTVRRQNSGKEELGERKKEREIHPAVAPQPGDLVVTKRRFGPFSTTDLFSVLENLHTETLILLGISTGGVVDATVRWAADIDYKVIVLEDCCADYDEEVHRVLVEKVFPRQATILSSIELLKALG